MKKDIIFVDTETTNLVGAMGNKLEFQPYIIEIFIRRTDQNLKVLDDFESLVKPPIPIPNFITKITGISDLDVVKSPKFKKVLKPIAKIMKGAQTFVAHNCTFDRDMIVNEFLRHGKKAPIPPHLYCTVEQSMHLMGYRLKNAELYKILTGKDFIKGQHRAKADVIATIKNYRGLKCR